MLGVGGEASWVLGLRPGRRMSPQPQTSGGGEGGGPGRCVEKMLVLDPGAGGRG